MNDKKRSLSEELEALEEVERIMEEVNSDPNLANITPPEEIRENLFREIRAYETARAMLEKEMFTEENKELIRLGKMYKRRRKWNKYLVLAAALVLALSFGITSMGGAEKIFETVKRNIWSREQVQVDSEENVQQTEDLSEERVYEEIEDRFGFHPVKLDYLPGETGFMEAELGEEIQRIFMIYGEDEKVKISYIIRPNFREGSWGEDIEDELIEEYEQELEKTIVHVKKYSIVDGTVRWSIQFEYKDVSYSLYILDEEKEEVEKIVEHLYFP